MVERKMAGKLTILFATWDGHGHVNACIGLAEKLRDRGHTVVFAVHDSWRGKLSTLGFCEEPMNPENCSKKSSNELDQKNLNAMISKMGLLFKLPIEKQLLLMQPQMLKLAIQHTKEYEPKLRRIVHKVQPDLIVADLMFQQPSVMNAGIPWVLSMSITPASIQLTENVPPAFTGFPTGQKYKELWSSLLVKQTKFAYPLFADFKDWVLQNGGPELEFGQLFLEFSPYANIYMYPKELDYTGFRPNPPNFYRFDTFMRSCAGGGGGGEQQEFQLPTELKEMPGKLIYFSMGTIGCSELGMMKRLIRILKKSPHRFIVSKGPRADKIKLGPNMCGAPYLPQTSIIPQVDLVISHGGNNTLTETFYFGKPIIVIPLYADQLDNAQRVQETGLGARLHSHKCTKEELLQTIDQLLNDRQLALRMEQIGKRIRSSNSQSRAALLIEQIAMNNN